MHRQVEGSSSSCWHHTTIAMPQGYMRCLKAAAYYQADTNPQRLLVTHR
jgi:hypothetical protein